MEALIWQHDSVDGADHGESCAAFASLTLELGAQVVGQQSWVTGGQATHGPCTLGGRPGEPNPASPASPRSSRTPRRIIAGIRWATATGRCPATGWSSTATSRWSPGTPAEYCHTIGGDSAAQFLRQRPRVPRSARQPGRRGASSTTVRWPPLADKAQPGSTATAAAQQPKRQADRRPAPGAAGRLRLGGSGRAARARGAGPSAAETRRAPWPTTAVIPGLPIMAHRLSPWRRRRASVPALQARTTLRLAASASVACTAAASRPSSAQVAPGAMAAQRKYGVPASVTIAQAIDESGWGRARWRPRTTTCSASRAAGPAGSDPLPTQEYQNGQLVYAPLVPRLPQHRGEHRRSRQALGDQRLLRKSMADRRNPNAFARPSPGMYATDPGYGAKLIGLMRRYDLYRYDAAAPAPQGRALHPGGHQPRGGDQPRRRRLRPAAASIPGLPVWAPTAPTRTASRSPAPTRTAPPSPAPSGAPSTGNGATGSQQPGPAPVPGGPTPATPIPSAAPTATGPSAAPSAAPSAGVSAGPAPSAASSGLTPSGRQSGGPSSAPAARSYRKAIEGCVGGAGAAAGGSTGRDSGASPGSGTIRGGGIGGGAVGPAPAGTVPASPAPSGATPAGRAPSGSAPSGPTPATRPASAPSAARTPSAAPSGPAHAARPSSPPSPAVPGLPVAADGAHWQ